MSLLLLASGRESVNQQQTNWTLITLYPTSGVCGSGSWDFMLLIIWYKRYGIDKLLEVVSSYKTFMGRTRMRLTSIFRIGDVSHSSLDFF